MFTIGAKVKIKSSGTLGEVVAIYVDDIAIKTNSGTFKYARSRAKRYLEALTEPACSCLTRETTELRNVITGWTLREYQDTHGPARGALDFPQRATGRTMGVAMSLLSSCIAEPYVWHTALDHHDHQSPAHSQSMVFQEASKLISLAALLGFECDPSRHSIRFVPIVKEVTTYEAKTVVTSLR